MITYEPELALAKLAEMGCPYAGSDDRAIVWLEGYQKGYDAATHEALTRIERFAGKHQF